MDRELIARRWLDTHDSEVTQAWIHDQNTATCYRTHTTTNSGLNVAFAIEVNLHIPTSWSTILSLLETFPDCALHLPGDLIISEKKCQLAVSSDSLSVAVIKS